jgi:hypothetical protein
MLLRYVRFRFGTGLRFLHTADKRVRPLVHGAVCIGRSSFGESRMLSVAFCSPTVGLSECFSGNVVISFINAGAPSTVRPSSSRHFTPCVARRRFNFGAIQSGYFDGNSNRQGGSMSKRIEFAIEKIVAACNDDLHGALRALMLVNEHLEGELEAMYAAMTTGGRIIRRASRSLH